MAVSPAYLFNAQTSAGNGTPVTLDWFDENSELECFGTWGGTTLTLQQLAQDGTTWITIKDGSRSTLSFTADEIFGGFAFAKNVTVRGVLTGGAGMTITAVIRQCGTSD